MSNWEWLFCVQSFGEPDLGLRGELVHEGYPESGNGCHPNLDRIWELTVLRATLTPPIKSCIEGIIILNHTLNMLMGRDGPNPLWEVRTKRVTRTLTIVTSNRNSLSKNVWENGL